MSEEGDDRRLVCPECGGEDVLVRMEAWFSASISSGVRQLDAGLGKDWGDDWNDDDKAHCEHCGWTGKAVEAERRTAPEGCLDVFGERESKRRGGRRARHVHETLDESPERRKDRDVRPQVLRREDVPVQRAFRERQGEKARQGRLPVRRRRRAVPVRERRIEGSPVHGDDAARRRGMKERKPWKEE